jgi:hypothetical protein
VRWRVGWYLGGKPDFEAVWGETVRSRNRARQAGRERGEGRRGGSVRGTTPKAAAAVAGARRRWRAGATRSACTRSRRT